VPEVDIRRRYSRSKDNFWNLYRYEVDSWYLICNSAELPQEVAIGQGARFEIVDEVLYNQFMINIKSELMNSRIERLEIYKEALQILRIANRAVRKAQMESRRLNVPNVYSRNMQLYYDQPELDRQTK